MNKLGLIIQREYLQMVGKKSFIVTTILVPILSILLCGVLPIMLSNVKSDEKKVVAVVDQTEGEQFLPLFSATDEYQFVTCTTSDIPSASDESYYDYYKQNDVLYAIVIIPQDIVSTQQLSILSEQSLSGSLESDIRSILYRPMRSLKIAAHDIEGLEEILQDCDVNLDVRTIKWGEDGKETVLSAMVSEIVGLCLAFLTYMFVLTYGAMIMSGVVEEKTNRIVEVIISSCKPIELMLGKIIGVALVGLTQFAVWGVLLGVSGIIATVTFGLGSVPDPSSLSADPALVEAAAMAPSQAGEIFQMIMSVNYPLILTCFLLYFVGGYLLYASLFAAFGSAVDQQQDTSQFMAPIMFFMVFALYAGMFSMQNPDGPLAWWCSMVPFTSPITMMVRLPFDVPVYEIALSLLILYVTAFLILWLAARIYRTGILMYGKKFSWKDILKWIRQ